jgi:hypothetical protein
MTLSAREQEVLTGMARRPAADDPGYAHRLAAFGGYAASPLGLPSRWVLLPALLLVGGVLPAAAFPEAAEPGEPRHGRAVPQQHR